MSHRRYSIFIGLVIIVGLSVAAYFLAPKGENQMYGHPTRTETVDDSSPNGMQHLAVLSYPSFRQLLPHVGHYISGTATPSHRTAAERPPKRISRAFLTDDPTSMMAEMYELRQEYDRHHIDMVAL